MPVTPLGYPLDLTGVAPSNLISNEIRTFTIAADRVFVPAGGPFFTTGMQIRHGVTNTLLQPNTQYKLLHLHKTACLMARKEICAVILILDNAVPSVKLTYQIIGSYFADTADTIRDLVTANPITNPTTIPWGSIFGAPSQFPPVEHLHHVDELYGMSDVVAVLEQLRQAILLGDSFAISAIYQYIHTLISNQNYATMSDISNAVNGAAGTTAVKMYEDNAELRAATDIVNNAVLAHVTLGRAAAADGYGRIFYWDAASMRTDNDNTVIKPTFIDVLAPGRYVSILAVEQDLIATNTETRARMRAHGIDSVLETDALYSGDIDEAVQSGDYWVNDSVINAPFNNAKLIVRPTAGTLSSPSTVMQELKNEYKTANRKGTLVYTSYIWTPWIYTSMDVSPDIGIVIRHLSDVPVLLPCYIGEDPNKNTVTVFISGKIQYINLAEIIPIYTSYADTGLFYIYLVEVALGSFRLLRYSEPPAYVDSAYSIYKRNSMYYPGESSITSNKLFVGMIFEYDGLLTTCRSWFRDPGFMEHYPNYNFRNADQLFGNYEIGKVSGKSKQLILEDEVYVYGIDAYESSAFLFIDGEGLPQVPVLVWANETVHLDFNISYSLNADANSLGVITFKNIVYNLGTVSPGISSVALENRVTNGPYTGPLVADATHVNPPTGHWDTLNAGYKYVSNQDSVLVTALGGRARITSGTGTLTLLPSTPVIATPTQCTVTLDQVHYFRNLHINSTTPQLWLGDNFTVQLYGDIFDLDLADRYVAVYGALPPENSAVLFVVNPGCFISASTTASYAVVNRGVWAAGCTVEIYIHAGGTIAGRGGDGGSGIGRKQKISPQYAYNPNYANDLDPGVVVGSDYPHDLIILNPATVGENGGNAIYSEGDIIIDNKGLISVGSGGGGGGVPSLFGNASFTWSLYVAETFWYELDGSYTLTGLYIGNYLSIASGGGGGGGWPYGNGGAHGILEYYERTKYNAITTEYNSDYNNQYININTVDVPYTHDVVPGQGADGLPSSKYISGDGAPIKYIPRYTPNWFPPRFKLNGPPFYQQNNNTQFGPIPNPATMYPYGWTESMPRYDHNGLTTEIYTPLPGTAGAKGNDIRSGYRALPTTNTLASGDNGTWAIKLTTGAVTYRGSAGNIYGTVTAPGGTIVL